MTDHYKVDQFLGANPGLLPLDVPATRSSSDPANYNLIERVIAGYIMNTFHFDHLSLQTGIASGSDTRVWAGIPGEPGRRSLW